MIKRVGFFRELGGHGDRSASVPSLRDAVRPTGEWDEDRVIAYLESSTEIYSTMGAERDVITGDEWISGAGSLVTDGTWLWPVELAHYVRNHHLALPAEFVDHIRANDYTSPALSHEQALEIFNEYFDRDASANTATSRSVLRPFVAWYLPALTSPWSQALVTQLGAAGLSVAHPLTDAVFGFRETEEGRKEPLMGGPDVLAASLASGKYREIEFQCWMGYDQSLAANVRRIDPSTQRFTFRIADVPEADRDEAIAALKRTLDHHAAHCLGFVIDRIGTSGGQDWDLILVGSGEQLTAWPDTIGIQWDRLSAHPEFAAAKPTEYGPLAVFHRPER
ncbi:hypothetical protein ACFYZE_06755 [Streptomyces sp. NPDC001796]|uniref:hypothetical protein n=1 Tax=Streptomyces sp. NPDC001796 TaxID=3364609 RepID=UPI00369CAAED